MWLTSFRFKFQKASLPVDSPGISGHEIEFQFSFIFFYYLLFSAHCAVNLIVSFSTVRKTNFLVSARPQLGTNLGFCLVLTTSCVNILPSRPSVAQQCASGSSRMTSCKGAPCACDSWPQGIYSKPRRDGPGVHEIIDNLLQCTANMCAARPVT